MNFFGLGPGEVILIGLVAMIVLGPEKLPEVAASAGRWIREFRRATEELTRQFTDENPFTEIQRAFTLGDEPAARPAESPAPAIEEAAPPAEEAPPTPALLPAPAAPTATVAATPTRVKSYYFTGPASHTGVDAEWTYGVPWRESRASGLALHTVLDDEWQHGVPTLSAPVDEAVHAATEDHEVLDPALAVGQEPDGASAQNRADAGEVTVAGMSASPPLSATVVEAEAAEPAADGVGHEPAATTNHHGELAPEDEDGPIASLEPVAVGSADAKGKNSEEYQR